MQVYVKGKRQSKGFLLRKNCLGKYFFRLSCPDTERLFQLLQKEAVEYLEVAVEISSMIHVLLVSQVCVMQGWRAIKTCKKRFQKFTEDMHGRVRFLKEAMRDHCRKL